MKKFVLVFFINLLSLNLFATSHLAFTCPDKFLGKVVSIKDVENSNLPKVEVSFQVLQTLKGDSFESKNIEVVKDGPVQFRVGKTYSIETRSSWLCSAEDVVK